jgi:hypothetical protein
MSIDRTVEPAALLTTLDKPAFVASGFPRFAGGHVGLVSLRVEVGRSACPDLSSGRHGAVEFLADESAKVVTARPEVVSDR